MFKILTILCCLSVIIFSEDLLAKFHQHDYDLKFMRADIVEYNKSVYKYFKIVTFKFNRSTPAINMTWDMKLDLDDSKTHLTIQGFKFLSNEYRIFPMRFLINFCHAFDHNAAGSRDVILHCGNMTECNLEKDRLYHVCNAYPDESRLPPYMPNGDYKLEITMTNGKAKLLVINAYGIISRPIKMH